MSNIDLEIKNNMKMKFSLRVYHQLSLMSSTTIMAGEQTVKT